MIKAKKDNYIRDLVKDVNYKIYKNGTILTKINLAGKVGENWRKLAKKNAGGGIVIRYKNKKLYLHRVIYQKFIGELDANMVINHKDHNPYNNKLSNLEHISIKENNKHRFINKEGVIGFYKLNFELAEIIRFEHKSGLTYRELIEKYKLSKSTISYIVNFKIWKKKIEIRKEGRKYKCDRKRIVPWTQFKKINEFYDQKPKGMSIDHIIPLHHPDVCGLHVIENLQYLSEKDNQIKRNFFDYTQENNSWKKKK